MNKNINATNGAKGTMDDQKTLDFYNLATGRILTGLEVHFLKTKIQFYFKFLVILCCSFVGNEIYLFLYFALLERSWYCTVVYKLEDSDVVFQHDSVFGKRWNWFGLWVEVSKYVGFH